MTLLPQHPNPTSTLSRPGTVHDYARRMAFLTEIDSQTWISRYTAAERLGDPNAVTSVPAYLTWLRRTGAAWSSVSMPTTAQTEQIWPFRSLPATAIEIVAAIEADLRDADMTAGTRHGRRVLEERPAAQGEQESCDAAYVCAAAYVAVSMAPEVAVLAADAEHLSLSAGRTPLPQRYLRQSMHVAGLRAALRRELATWADRAGTEAAERVVLTARMLTDQLSEGLLSPRSGC